MESATEKVDKLTKKLTSKATYTQDELDQRVNIAATHAATIAVTNYKADTTDARKEIKKMDKNIKKAEKLPGAVAKANSGIELQKAIAKAAVKAEVPKPAKTKDVKKPHASEAKNLLEAMKSMAGDPAGHNLNSATA